jgi:uncharacterized protein (DUF488 family)
MRKSCKNLIFAKKSVIVFFATYYERRSIDQLLTLLISSDVKTLVDTRENPFSKKAEFEMHNLFLKLKESGISYICARDLGCPRPLRIAAVKSGCYKELWAWYDRFVLPRLCTLLSVLKSYKPNYAFLCLEKDRNRCHRSRIVYALMVKGYEITEL